MKEIENIITEQMMWHEHVAAKSSYKILKHGEKFHYQDQEWNYINSGLARDVYRSDCGKWVIKIPNCDFFDEEMVEEFLKGDRVRLHPSINHNYHEALAYQNCPKEFKKHLADTRLIDNTWITQEYVKVLETSTGGSDLREIGLREDGSYCIFDYDPLLNDFKFDGYNWNNLESLVNGAIQGIE